MTTGDRAHATHSCVSEGLLVRNPRAWGPRTGTCPTCTVHCDVARGICRRSRSAHSCCEGSYCEEGLQRAAGAPPHDEISIQRPTHSRLDESTAPSLVCACVRVCVVCGAPCGLCTRCGALSVQWQSRDACVYSRGWGSGRLGLGDWVWDGLLS
jgi:hypothetical protein